jgi:hypothetical protein
MKVTKTILFKAWVALAILGGLLALTFPAGRVYGHLNERSVWMRDCDFRERNGIEPAPRMRGFCEGVRTSVSEQPNDFAYAIMNSDVRYSAIAVSIVWLRLTLLTAASLLGLGFMLRLFSKLKGRA